MQRLGRYELVAPIGMGGMARIFLARALGPAGFEKKVALKMIHHHLAQDPTFVALFLREARLAARLDHPNIVQVLELGREQDTYFIAMEYLEGEPLNELMRRLHRDEVPPLEPRLACHLIMKACEGLHHAHDLTDDDGRPFKLVHRDVSPQNLFVTYSGSLKLMDFGVARARATTSQHSAETLRGKISYMSPEQARGQPLDRRSDVFSLGIVLWELLAGQYLFRRNSEAESLRLVGLAKVPKLAGLRRELPRKLCRVVHKALGLKPRGRYQTAEQFHDDLAATTSQLGPPMTSLDLGQAMVEWFGPDGPQRKEEKIRESHANLEDILTPNTGTGQYAIGATRGTEDIDRPRLSGAVSRAASDPGQRDDTELDLSDETPTQTMRLSSPPPEGGSLAPRRNAPLPLAELVALVPDRPGGEEDTDDTVPQRDWAQEAPRPPDGPAGSSPWAGASLAHKAPPATKTGRKVAVAGLFLFVLAGGLAFSPWLRPRPGDPSQEWEALVTTTEDGSVPGDGAALAPGAPAASRAAARKNGRGRARGKRPRAAGQRPRKVRPRQRTSRVVLSFAVEPRHARVSINGKRRNPRRIVVPKSSRALQVVVSAAGYRSRSFSVVPTRSSKRRVVLQRAPAAAAPSKSPAAAPAEQTKTPRALLPPNPYRQ